MKRKTQIASTAAALLIAAGAASFFYGSNVGASADTDTADAGDAAAPSGPPPAPVSVAAAERRLLAPHSDSPGSVVATYDSLVAAATSGKIEWVADVGAEVAEGDVIARIDPADARLTRDDNAAAVRRLTARADYLDSFYKRFLSLGEDAGESAASLDEMRSNRDEAMEAVKQAQVAHDRAEIVLARTDVKAPFDGRIVSRQIQIGEFANPGTQLVRLVDTRRLEVSARAPANLVRNISAGDTIQIANGAETASATVRAIVPVGDALSRMLELRLEIPETGWYIGSAVRVRLPAKVAKTVTAVPRDALVLRADRISVFVISEDKTARRVDVELGTAEGDFIEVIGDIDAGDDVVIRGGERLRDGQTVTIATNLDEPSA
jgi:RND family efflux transporter MFP subunit